MYGVIHDMIVSSKERRIWEMKRYYMTAESADDELYEHQGNIRGARSIAQKLANDRNETVFINDVVTEDIVECVWPD